jgi:hypothetical protein
MNLIDSALENFEYKVVLSESYAQVYTIDEKRTIICEICTDYVPIVDFKRIFLEMTALIKEGDFDKFIFDKRSLRAFHQPSMEWYYLEWKKSILAYGVTKHRKILPDEVWFEKMVFVAKDQILKANPNNIIDQLDIKYCKSIEEAIAL